MQAAEREVSLQTPKLTAEISIYMPWSPISSSVASLWCGMLAVLSVEVAGDVLC